MIFSPIMACSRPSLISKMALRLEEVRVGMLSNISSTGGSPRHQGQPSSPLLYLALPGTQSLWRYMACQCIGFTFSWRSSLFLQFPDQGVLIAPFYTQSSCLPNFRLVTGLHPPSHCLQIILCCRRPKKALRSTLILLCIAFTSGE